MKHFMYVSTILILLFFQVGFTQVPVSFRSRALGGIIDDDLDLVYDPIELSFVKGTRVYTNLSNLTSSNEQILNGVSDKEFLIGISTENPFVKSLWTSALVRFSNAQNSNQVVLDTDLDGRPDEYGNGILESNFTAFIDNNGDGNYDIKNIINQTTSNISLDKGNSFILNNAYDLNNNMIVGLKLVKGSYYRESNVANDYLGSGEGVLIGAMKGDPDFTRSVTNRQIVQDYIDSDWSERGDFLSSYSSNYFNIAASILLKDIRKYEVRANLVYNHQSTLNEIKDSYSGKYEYFNPNIANYENNYSENESYHMQNEENGGGIFLGATIRQTFDKKEQRKNDGYWRLGAGMFFGSYDYKNNVRKNFVSEKNRIENNIYTDFTDERSRLNSTLDTGDKSYHDYSLHLKINYPLGDRVYIGLGGFFNYSSIDRNTNYNQSFKATRTYTLVDNNADYSDYAETETRGLSAKRNYKISTVYFRAPVGIEYRFTKNMKWAVRFGSIFYYMDQDITDMMDILNSDPYKYQIVRGDGSSNTSVSNNKYTSTKNEVKYTSTNTVFSYGLGYNPTENLQIDLLGFLGTANNSLLDANFYRSLRLSFTFKF